MSENTKAVTDASFENDVLKSSQTVVVDFWAEWCGPCKMLSPVLDEVAGEMQGKITVLKMNVDENPMMPSKYGVRGIPTLMVFKDGQLKATKVGALTKPILTTWLGEQA